MTMLLLLSGSPAALAQPASPATDEGPAPPTAAPAASEAEDDAAAVELDGLMAPVALFPDPVLAAVLQASVVPLDVVKAARFLDDYAKDPKLVPDTRWDPAVRSLLAFPTVL